VKNSEHFIKSRKDIKLQNEDYLVSSEVVSLFTKLPVEEVLQTLYRSFFPRMLTFTTSDLMELLDICLTTTYFQFEDKFCQQKKGTAMENSLSLVVTNIFMEHFGEIALDTADHNPAKWLRYVDDTSVALPGRPTRLLQFLHHLNSIRPTIKFTMK
jgi:hypothetical protein